MSTHEIRQRKNRIAARLERLRKDLPAAWKESQVDKDHTSVTSDHPSFSWVRTYYLGEICWVERTSWPVERTQTAGQRTAPRAAIVLERQNLPGEPVKMAPGMRHAPANTSELCFQAQDNVKRLEPGTIFVLPFYRPIQRVAVLGHFATLSGKDKQRLAQEVALQLGKEGSL